MKMTPDTRKHLALAIEELITTRSEEQLQAYRKYVSYTNDQFIAFIWGLYYKLQQPDRTAIRNNQGTPLADSHIETALKQILKGYK